MPTTKPPRQKKIKKSNPSSSKKEIQGVLLLERVANKYEAYGVTEKLIDRLNNLFARKGNKLIQSTSGDEIYYLNDHLKTAIDILENSR